MMARWQKYELIALDEVGYVPSADIGAELLFQVISERAERAVITGPPQIPITQPYQRWECDAQFRRYYDK